MRALILDPGSSRSALAGCRALGRAGWFVGLACPADRPRTIATRSRWARRLHRVPSPAGDAERFAAAVAAAVRDGGYDVVLPAGDAEAVTLSAHREAVPAVVPYAPHSVVQRAFDKAALAEAAGRCGILVPAPAAADDLPVVVKGRSHVAGRHEAVMATTAEELAAAVRRLEEAGVEPLLQDVVSGELVAVAAVADRHCEVLAAVQQRALHLWPPGAGVSTRAETVAADPALAQATASLLRELGWFGLAQLQFVVPADGLPRLIDFNGRLYGSLALAHAAGVPLAELWAATALDVEFPGPLPKATPGRRYQWLEGDLRRAMVERRHGLAGDVAATLAYAVGARHSILSAGDPVPAVAHGLDLARRAYRKARR